MAGGAGPPAFADTVPVDAPTARELLEEIHQRITGAQIIEIVGLLEVKAARFAAALEPAALAVADEAGLRAVLRGIFVSRRQVGALFGVRPAVELRDTVGALLWDDAPVGRRVAAFCAAVQLADVKAVELAGELLHFSNPTRYWLASRFIYNADTRTGALPLLVTDGYDLEADSIGAAYERLGGAMRSVDDSPEAASFRRHGGGTLATDVFLACVYGVYMNTVLGLKMSQEFNSLVPPLPQLARRLLGVHRMEVQA
ncbi:hypothetical protein NBH00_11870 [Paraconexibacter antarcticus]|uniref:Uncharacterized protein n=1 Tax=Paraconexibacter antarcticus TaxID=2949664 RepID=A0ABY5DXW9_9ACTN|nr:hypothetical protein [Paraconexibacter antarcticus]UTI66878.1 hypothetical protein NBH00_11870 [Paraconexibacter antarcticus]